MSDDLDNLHELNELRRMVADLATHVASLYRTTNEMRERIADLEADKCWIAIGHLTPDNRYWAATAIHVQDWPTLELHYSPVRQLSMATSSAEAWRIAAAFEAGANEEAGTA